MSAPIKHLLLIGAGHAHVGVLADFVRNGLPCDKVTLLSPASTLRYSGMVPGWISGQYDRDAGVVDIVGLAASAGVEFVQDRCIALDPNVNSILTQSNGLLQFDVVSINSGGVGRSNRILGNDPRIIDVRPIDHFVEKLEASDTPKRVAVVGGGAAGVEIAFALRNRRGSGEIVLVAGKNGVLPDFACAVRKRVERRLEAQGIEVIAADAGIEGGILTVDGISLEPVDQIIAALGSTAPDWPAQSGLEVDAEGFIAIGSHLLSTSHDHIFAVGDIAARLDRNVAHSGVHAVMAAPALAANLRRELQGKPTQNSYIPRPASLYLMSTGDGSAIGSYGPLAFEGRWVAWLKNRIDTGWISKYAALARKQQSSYNQAIVKL